MKADSQRKISSLFLVLIFFSIIFIRNAWIGDDALLTFRSIFNFVDGYGARFNLSERVQVYTHPLWFLILSGAYSLCRDFGFVTYFVSYFLCLFTIYNLYNITKKETVLFFFGTLLLISSKSFMDFTTSGLEGPLAYFLLSVLWVRSMKFRDDPSPQNWFYLILISSLLVATRYDYVLLVSPLLLLGLIHLNSETNMAPRALLKNILLGSCYALPIWTWFVISFFYYGSIFPNTLLGKTNVRIGSYDFMKQGFVYLMNFIDSDFIGSIILFGALSIGFTKRKNILMLGSFCGVLLYTTYILIVGGDFMSGRFFSTLVLISVFMLTEFFRSRITHGELKKILFVVLAFNFFNPNSPILSDSSFGRNRNQMQALGTTGIVDERAWYYQERGLLRWTRNFALFTPELNCNRSSGGSYDVLVQGGGIGIRAFHSCREVHAVDTCGLGDALLARLPFPYNPERPLLDQGETSIHWRIGHLDRLLPIGYLDTIKTKRNLIQDSEVSKIYNRVYWLTQAPLWETERLKYLFRVIE